MFARVGRRGQRNRMRAHATDLRAAHPAVRGAVLGGVGLLAWGTAEYIRVRQGRRRAARWMAKDLNALDRAGRAVLRWRDPARADRLSDLLAFGAAPAACAWALWQPGEPFDDLVLRDGLAITEAAVLTGLVNQVTKQLAMRERPLAAGAPRRAHLPDRYGSFFSGHSASVAVVCASAGLRKLGDGVRTKRLLALPALPLLTAYLRVAADKHYLTDVLAGVGVGVGVALLDTWIALGPGRGSVARDAGIDGLAPGVDAAL